ncbi:MAG: alpha/beta hydrolase [Acidimicrobiales bacterium]|nr:alpha/beta hydrolase [Acidimicrobiales bacterium]MCB9372177.1 alpha/beta hydrolase [Microthrixaceae bacterium]
MRSVLRVLGTVSAVVVLVATAGVTAGWISPDADPVDGADAADLAALENRASSTERADDALPAGCTTVAVTPPTSADERLGDLCVPEGAHRDVAVILVHGGGGFGGTRGDMSGWAEVYQFAGYVTLSVDYLIFGETTRSPVYPEPEQDVKAAVQWVRDHAGELRVDLDRIVVHGSSAGSRLGGQVYVSGDDPYYYGSEMWPTTPDHVNGFIGFYGYYTGLSADEERYYGGARSSPDPDVQERWKKANTVVNADGAHGPALLIHGELDGVIPVGQTERFADALERAGKDVTTKVVPGADHGFDVVDGGALTDDGRAIARTVLDWLDWQFPQGRPSR